MKIYNFFRLLLFVCLVAIFIIASLYYYSFITDKIFALSSALIAFLAGVFGLFSNKPTDKNIVNQTVDKMIETYESNSIKTIIQTKKEIEDTREEERKIKEYINKKSNEIFLIKTREYLIDDALDKYQNSNLKKIIDEISNIENQLETMQVQYKDIELPANFKELLKNLDQRRQFDLYLDLVDDIPFLPFKKSLKSYLRLEFQKGNITIPTSRGK